jgi:asparagine synthase (glutamine-hydrolysing)
MSGMTGFFRRDDRPADRADLARMVERIAHRGPDGAGVWCDGPAALGHRMLWTTPESLQETLPRANPTGDLVITADARIDNREELIAACDPGGRPCAETSDSELILAAYERWGEACVEKLLGDFAFAIWDKRRQTMFCARDHMGVKPFYYHLSDRLFVFGSEIKALLCLEEVPRRLNEVRVADYLCSLLEDKEITFYQEILRLPPAHTLTVGRNRAERKQYWRLDPMRHLRLGSDQEYADGFRSIFTEAVRCRLRSAFPVGSMLSGGLDSSSIVCVARKVLAGAGRPLLHTFSATFEDVPECDERPFINAVVAQGGVEAHFVRGDRISPLLKDEPLLVAPEEPFYGANLYLHCGLFRAAVGQNVRVLLDGFEGDAVVSLGIKRLADLMRAGRWRETARTISKLARDFNRPRLRLWCRHAIKPCLPPLTRSTWLMLRNRVHPTWDPEHVINRAFARRIGLPERVHALGMLTEPRGEREAHLRRLEAGVMPFSREAADLVAASVGIEPSYPFADKRLVEFCLALPSEQKLQQGWTRWIVRRAMDGILPKEVQWRGGKSDLSGSFNRGLRTFERDLLDDLILARPAVLTPYLDVERLRAVYRRYLSEGTSATAMVAWKALTLGLWLERFERTGCGQSPVPQHHRASITT